MVESDVDNVELSYRCSGNFWRFTTIDRKRTRLDERVTYFVCRVNNERAKKCFVHGYPQSIDYVIPSV